MCGISGLLKLDGSQADPCQLGTMIATLRHRGPDANGVELSGPAGLAHARLSIIDLQSGAQPMSTTDGRLSITLMVSGHLRSGTRWNRSCSCRATAQAFGHYFIRRPEIAAFSHPKSKPYLLVRRCAEKLTLLAWTRYLHS